MELMPASCYFFTSIITGSVAQFRAEEADDDFTQFKSLKVCDSADKMQNTRHAGLYNARIFTALPHSAPISSMRQK